MSKVKKVLEFHADWCGPCQVLKPIVEELEKEHPDIEFVSLNIDKRQEEADEHEVMSIPTLVFLDKKGKVIETFVGLKSKQDIEKVLK